MGRSHYSQQELFDLRNHIPIKNLIRTLGIPSRMIEGYFRFACPVCHEFNTAINPKTNLARCFDCNKNFNPIDLTIIVKEINFLQAVSFLEKVYKEAPHSYPPQHNRASLDCTVTLNDILKSIGKQISPHNGKKQEAALSLEQLNNRVINLEKKVDQIIHYIKQLATK